MLSSKTLLLLISFAVLSNCFGFLPQDSPISRQIPLFSDDGEGFYMESIFYSQEDSPEVRMDISITGSQSLFGECWGFDKLVCESKYGCSVSSDHDLYEFPYVSAPSSSLSARTEQDPFFWSLTKKLFGTDCDGGPLFIPMYGMFRQGVVGMGIKNYPWGSDSFAKSFSFSFSEVSKREGILYLGPRPDSPGKLITTLQADQDWITSFSQSTFGIRSKSIPFTGRLLFDISYSAIGFTKTLYQHFLLALQTSVPGLICTPVPSEPICPYSGKISDLPPLVIGGGNQESLTIPAEVYARWSYDTVTSKIILNIKQIGTKGKGPRYINPAIAGGDDAAVIILDSKFLNYTSAEFEFPSPDVARIKIYEPKPVAIEA